MKQDNARAKTPKKVKTTGAVKRPEDIPVYPVRLRVDKIHSPDGDRWGVSLIDSAGNICGGVGNHMDKKFKNLTIAKEWDNDPFAGAMFYSEEDALEVLLAVEDVYIPNPPAS